MTYSPYSVQLTQLCTPLVFGLRCRAQYSTEACLAQQMNGYKDVMVRVGYFGISLNLLGHPHSS